MSLCCTVVAYCHQSELIMTRFLYRAQDHNMTNGDFAFFMFYSHPTSYIVKPWNYYVDDPSDLSRRRTAYYAVKEVVSECVASE